MNVTSLADLQAQADAEEGKQEQVAVEQETEELEESDTETETEEEESTEEEDDESEEKASEDEDWAKPDAKHFVPAKVHSELRKSLRATQSDADAVKTENEQLKARLAALEGGQASQQAQTLVIPTLANCNFDDDLLAQRTAEYSEALVEQKLAEREKNSAANSQQAQLNAQINSQVEQHYERAGELIGKGSVTEDNFKSADLLVRKAIAEVAKGDPDYIADYMIAKLGAGSEKVMYHLGVNPKALNELKEAFRSDPTGIAAASYLGELKGKFNSAQPTKLSNAPKPDKVLTGTAKVTTESARKAYLKAEKSDDISGMLAAKRAAKGKGIDTSNW